MGQFGRIMMQPLAFTRNFATGGRFMLQVQRRTRRDTLFSDNGG